MIFKRAADRIYQYLLDEEKSGTAVREIREACRRYSMKKTIAAGGTKRQKIPRSWVKNAYMKQEGVCHRCHKEMLFSEAVGDHLNPIANGGKHHPNNIRAVHESCNATKGSNDMVRESKLRNRTIMEMIEHGDIQNEQRGDKE